MSEEKKKQNPIDPDKVVDNPGLIDFAHHVGSAKISKINKSKIQGQALASMYEQTDSQLSKIKDRVEDLLREAQEIQERKVLSEKIYNTKLSFKPIIGRQYYLYLREDGTHMLSMIAPQEWGRSSRLDYVATVALLSDYTWNIIDKNEDHFSGFKDV